MREELKKILFPFKVKIFANSLLDVFFKSLGAALAASAAVALLAKIKPLPNAPRAIIALLAISVVGSIIFALATKLPDDKAAAKAADSLGYKERFVTAEELCRLGALTPMQTLAVNDALEKGKNGVSKPYKIKFPLKTGVCCAALSVCLALVIVFIPSPRKIKAEKLTEKQLNAAQTAVTDLKSDKTADKNSVKEIEKNIVALKKELKKELKKTSYADEAVSKIDETMSRLKKLEKSGEGAPNAATLDFINSKLAESKTALKEAQIAQNDSQTTNADNLQADASDDAQNKGQGGQNVQNNQSPKNGDATSSEKQNASGENGQNQNANDGDKSAQNGDGQNGKGQNGGAKNATSNNEGQNGEGGGKGHLEGDKKSSRDALGLQGEKFSAQSKQNESGSFSQSRERAYGGVGEYDLSQSSAAQYRAKALKAMEEQSAPYGMQTLVDDYFKGLSE